MIDLFIRMSTMKPIYLSSFEFKFDDTRLAETANRAETEQR